MKQGGVKMKSSGLYIHIPFCRSKCIYCDFYSLPGAENMMDDYLRAVIRETELRGSRNIPVDTVYFGGGTPSHFGYGRLMTLLREIRKNFTLTEECEITFEANPESVTEDGLGAMRRAGFNRISIGVQSFDDGDLKNLNRPHSALQAVQAVNTARAAGFENISIDLIFALPGQNMERWEKNLNMAADLPITHLSCYGLTPEEGTPLVSSPLMELLPDEDVQADMYLRCAEVLENRGFEQYEISNFARCGLYSRHNMRYWTLRAYIGLGAAAHSDFAGRRSANKADINEYIGALREGRLPVEEELTVSPEERARERVMLGLRTSRGIRSGYFLDEPAFFELAGEYAAHGLGRLNDDTFSLTPAGYMVSNGIINNFLDIPLGKVTGL